MKNFLILSLIVLGSCQLPAMNGGNKRAAGAAMSAAGANGYQAAPDAPRRIAGDGSLRGEREVYCQCQRADVKQCCSEYWFDVFCCFVWDDKQDTCRKCGMFIIKAVSCPLCCLVGLGGCCCYYGGQCDGE